MVKRTRLTTFSCKAVGHGPERVPVRQLASEIGSLLRRGRPFPPRAVLDDVFSRGRALGSHAVEVVWKSFRLVGDEYEELRLECVTDPHLGLLDASPPAGIDTFGQWREWLERTDGCEARDRVHR